MVQSVKYSSHRIMKKVQFLTDERYPQYIYCHEIENISYLCGNRRFITIESGERLLRIAHCEKTPLQFDNNDNKQ